MSKRREDEARLAARSALHIYEANDDDIWPLYQITSTICIVLTMPYESATRDTLHNAKHRQASYYDHGVKVRPTLAIGQIVDMKMDDMPECRKAQIVDMLPYHSYMMPTR